MDLSPERRRRAAKPPVEVARVRFVEMHPATPRVKGSQPMAKVHQAIQPTEERWRVRKDHPVHRVRATGAVMHPLKIPHPGKGSKQWRTPVRPELLQAKGNRASPPAHQRHQTAVGLREMAPA
jgi:hypothetical protein